MEAFEHIAYFETVFVGEGFASVEIFVGGHFSRGEQAHYHAEEAFLPFHRLVGIIERGVGGLGEVELTVDDAHPLQIGFAGLGGLHEQLHALCYARCGAFVAVAARAVALTAHDGRALRAVLSHGADGAQAEQECCYISVDVFHCHRCGIIQRGMV